MADPGEGEYEGTVFECGACGSDEYEEQSMAGDYVQVCAQCGWVDLEAMGY